jgi:large subunit ribosomal protein L15
MVVRFKKKTRKLRGKKTHGYGSKKKHRGKGSKGGKGYAGSHKHKWTYIIKYEPDHFGKHGFVSRKKQFKKEKIINVGEIEKLINKLGLDPQNVIDLEALGYTKLLGSGNIDIPVKIKISSYSQHAIEKIEKVGGEIVK